MDRKQAFYARQLFELRVRQAKGAAFQDIFNAVMQLRCPRFVPMRPYGNVGDRKNDGYIPDTGTFFQVYAPASPSRSLADAVNKARDDFRDLRSHWNGTHPIRAYRFVFNDEYSGSVVPLELALAQIGKAWSIDARVFLAKDLEAEAFQLPLDQLERAIDMLVPDSADIPDADYAALRDVIEHVMRTDAPTPPTGKLLASEFTAKIRFNRLSQAVADLLHVAARQNEVVADFFSSRSGTHRQDLRDHLAEMYERARTATRINGATSDQVFFAILEAMKPPSRRRDRQVQEAALIVMAYYFEACDIFEPPDAAA